MARRLQCGKPRHPAERRLGEDLESGLPDDWLVLAGADLADSRGNWDLDVTVAGPPGIVAIEVKHWWGKIAVDHGPRWYRGTSSADPVGNPLNSIRHKQRILRSKMADRRHPNVSVLGVVVMTHSRAELTGPDDVLAHVMRSDQLIDRLLSRKLVFDQGNIIDCGEKAKDALEELLHGAHGRRDRVPTLHGYDQIVKEHADELRGYTDYDGRRVSLGDQVSIRWWEKALDPDDGSFLDSRVRRENLALLQIRSPHVLALYDAFVDPDFDDSLYVVTERLPGEPIGNYFGGIEGVGAEKFRDWIRGAFEGLEACHRADVVHRGINGMTLHIHPRRGSVLTGFEVARVRGLATVHTRTHDSAVGGFKAPEVKEDHHAASVQSDLFSLSRTLSYVAAAPIRSPAEARNALTSVVGEQVADILARCQAESPADRPDSAREVLAVLAGA